MGLSRRKGGKTMLFGSDLILSAQKNNYELCTFWFANPDASQAHGRGGSIKDTNPTKVRPVVAAMQFRRDFRPEMDESTCAQKPRTNKNQHTDRNMYTMMCSHFHQNLSVQSPPHRGGGVQPLSIGKSSVSDCANWAATPPPPP